MTADGFAGELRAAERAATAPSTAAVLSACDRVLSEVGRRSHLFSWLRSGPGEWLPVDCYYPRNHLVVLCRDEPSPDDAVYERLVPEHGLHLLRLTPAQLAADPAALHAALEQRIAALSVEVRAAKPSRPAPAPAAPASVPARPAVAVALEALARESPRPSGSRAPAPPAAGPEAWRGALIALALCLALLLELYVGVAVWAMGHGHLLLAFGLAIDTCARALGTIAAARSGQGDYVWLCALGGSLAVAPFALFGSSGPVRTEPAPLAGLLAVLALGVLAVTAAGALLGI
jgi:cell division septation protein DedD